MASPILKWVGGKGRLLTELRARRPLGYKRYFEPFAGGGALFFDLEPVNAVIADTNEALIDVYLGVARDVEGVIEMLKVHQRAHFHDEKYYYMIREAWNDGGWLDDRGARAAAFIYMNKTCFNGLWRVNKSGKFNTPRGDYKNPKILDEETLRVASKLLAKATVNVEGYGATTSAAKPGDFVYMDPPYDPLSDTSNFTAYNKEGFGKEQQKLLADHARMLANRGVHVMLSNNDTPYIRSLYDDFHIDTVQCGRSISSKGTKRGPVNEVIMTSYVTSN